jgi:L,D-transpeptidase ErfK/SrfK
VSKTSGAPIRLVPSAVQPAGAAVVEPGAPETRSAALSPPAAVPVPAASNPQAADQVVGQLATYRARFSDSLLDIGLSTALGYNELVAANPGVDPWLPGEGTTVLLPKANILPDAPREGIVINLPEQRLYYFSGGALVMDTPIGIFREGFSTPQGTTTVTRKTVNPTWYPPASSRADDPTLPAAVPPGPDNPLGSRAIYLGWLQYLIHGTNKPYGVGRRVSRGCIRAYPDQIEKLYDRVSVGTPVRVVNQPVKLGWWHGELFLEAHLTIEQTLHFEDEGKFDAVDDPQVHERVVVKAGAFADRVDWATVDRAIRERRGYPIQITNVSRPVVRTVEATVPPIPPQTQKVLAQTTEGSRGID